MNARDSYQSSMHGISRGRNAGYGGGGNQVAGIGDLYKGANTRGLTYEDVSARIGPVSNRDPGAMKRRNEALQRAKNQRGEAEGEYYNSGLNYIGGKIEDYDGKIDATLGDQVGINREVMGDIRSEMDQNTAMRNKYMSLYEPLTQKFLAEAQRAEIADERGQADIADSEVAQQFDMQRGELQRNAARYGQNPMDDPVQRRAMRIAEAAARGSARTNARRQERDRVQGLNFGKMAQAMGTRVDPGQFSNSSLASSLGAMSQSNTQLADRYIDASRGAGVMMSDFHRRHNPNTGSGRAPQTIINGRVM